ncbi:hypothetical protein J4717_06680 [Phaeobacter sp. HS012]|nr:MULTISPECIES: hypothetical protein [unclassified Phaeobacter]MBQ4807149.1 hypothetical protein [Phaeobacter sp. HS012]MBQ4882187.1 hypothetical protein [Phaeobacter sp. HS011]
MSIASAFGEADATNGLPQISFGDRRAVNSRDDALPNLRMECPLATRRET